MEIDFDLLRTLVRKAAAEAPHNVHAQRPILDIDDKDDGFKMSIAIPDDEGPEFSHWRLLHEFGFVRMSHEGRPGIGKLGTRVDGLSAKGFEFLALSQSEDDWRKSIEVCRRARALTVPNVVGELRTSAKRRIRDAKQAMARQKRPNA